MIKFFMTTFKLTLLMLIPSICFAETNSIANTTTNLPDGTQVTILQEYAKSYMVTKTGEHKPFFIEKTKKVEVGNIINDAKEIKELDDIVNNYKNHAPCNNFRMPTIEDSPQERQFTILNFPSGEGIPYVKKLIEVTENLKNSNYFGANDITKYYISLRPNFEKYNIDVKNQGNNINNTCSIFAMASAIEYQLAKNGHLEKVSIPFLTWAHDQTLINLSSQGKLYSGDQAMTVEGTKEKLLRTGSRSMDNCAVGINRFGILSSQDLPLSTMNSVVRNGIPENLTRKASPTKITLTQCSVYTQISYSSTYEATKNFNDFAIKDELRKGNPVIAGIMLDTKNTPTFISKYGGHMGGHAILIVGFYSATGKDEDTVYEFLNSWGNKWGIGGYGWITSKMLVPAITTLESVTIN